MCDFPTSIRRQSSMDPLYEQNLRAEVIYLHSLWHQGPPRSTAAAVRYHHHLQPVQTTHFKKENIHKRDSSPGLAWPVPSTPPSPPTDAWPTVKSKPYPNPQTLSPEEQSKSTGKIAHHNAIKALAAFFRSNKNSNVDSDSDSDSGSGSGSDSSDSFSEEDDSMDEDDGQDERDFFDKVFVEDTNLRDYYGKSFAKGEFSCLVCGALGGKNMGKKFNGCMALVQHSIAIAKMKRKKAHRAFGEAVCKVLGWDINRLSSIVSLLSDKPEEARETGGVDNKGITVEGDVVEGKNDEAVPESSPIVTEISRNGGEGETNSLTCDDADKSSEGVEPAAHGSTNENCSGDNNEKSPANVEKVLTVEGKTDEAIPESGAIIDAGTSLDGDEGHMPPRMDADKSSEVLCMVQEPASDSLTSSSLSGPGAHRSSENVVSIPSTSLQEVVKFVE